MHRLALEAYVLYPAVPIGFTLLIAWLRARHSTRASAMECSRNHRFEGGALRSGYRAIRALLDYPTFRIAQTAMPTSSCSAACDASSGLSLRRRLLVLTSFGSAGMQSHSIRAPRGPLALG